MLLRVDYLKTHDNFDIRYGIWTADRQTESAGKHSIVFLNGRAEFMEKHEETIHELNQKGFDVCSMDWRGQGLSSRMLPERHKGYVRSYGDYLEDLHRFISQIVRLHTRGSVFLLAHSLGAHIALRYVHDHPGVVEKLLLVSPMIDIVTTPFPKWLVHCLVKTMARCGFQNRYAPGSENYLISREKFENNRLTSDPSRFMDDKRAIWANPDLALGGVTYGWLDATIDSIGILNHPGYVDRITEPVQMILAGLDQIVSINAARNLSNAMTNSAYIILPTARHEILKEMDAIRSVFWEAFDRFMLE